MATILNQKSIEETYASKKKKGVESIVLNEGYRKMAIKSKKGNKLKSSMSQISKPFSSPGLEKITLNENLRGRAIAAKKRKAEKKQKNPLTIKSLNLDSYSEVKVTPQIICSIVDMLCEQFSFLYIEGMALYVYTEDYYHLFTYAYAGQFLRKTFRKNEINYAFRTCEYKEIVNQLKAQECIAKCPEDCRTNTNIVLFSDGAFNVLNGTMQPPLREDYQFSKIDFPLLWGKTATPTPDAKHFIQRFCSFDDKKEAYLWELVGYLLSNYQEKNNGCLLWSLQFRQIYAGKFHSAYRRNEKLRFFRNPGFIGNFQSCRTARQAAMC